MAQVIYRVVTQINSGAKSLSYGVLNWMMPFNRNLPDVINYSRHV